MKKSELRNIIRESIKEMMSERSYAGGTPDKTDGACKGNYCNCSSTSPEGDHFQCNAGCHCDCSADSRPAWGRCRGGHRDKVAPSNVRGRERIAEKETGGDERWSCAGGMPGGKPDCYKSDGGQYNSKADCEEQCGGTGKTKSGEYTHPHADTAG